MTLERWCRAIKITLSAIRKLPLNLLTKFVRMVLRLCDELDKAKDINDYFKLTLLKYINEKINPQLVKLQDETLVKEFTRQWNNYTILVNFMKKMFSYLVSIPTFEQF